MEKKTQKLKPDTVLKNYWRDNERFADLFNAVLFDGRQVIKPEELEDADTEESSVLEHRQYAESIQESRDNVKVCKKSTAFGVELVMLGLESQEHIHYAMPIRVMGYDYGAYKKQYDDNARKYQTSKGMSEDEYLSRMKKTDRFAPVITMVVYYGENPWDGAVSLHDMLSVPEEMMAFVNDYRVLLVEARKNNLKLHNVKNIDFFHMLEMFLDKTLSKDETKKKAIDYAREHHVDKSVIMTVAGAVNCKIDFNAITGEGEVGMCTFVKEIAAEGRAEGEAKGMIEFGLEFGISETEILERLQKKLNLSLQEAKKYIEIYGKQNAQ